MNSKIVKELPKVAGNAQGLLAGKEPLTRVLACKRKPNVFLEHSYRANLSKTTNENEREHVMLDVLEKLLESIERGEGDKLGIIPMFEISALESSFPDVVVKIIQILRHLHSRSISEVYGGLDKEEIEAVVKNIISQRTDVLGLDAYGLPTTSQA